MNRDIPGPTAALIARLEAERAAPVPPPQRIAAVDISDLALVLDLAEAYGLARRMSAEEAAAFGRLDSASRRTR